MLLPLTYILGILITEIFVLFLILFFFLKNRQIEIYINKIFIFLLLFSVYIGVNALIQIPHQDLLISSIFHFRFTLFAISIVFVLNYLKGEKNINNSNILYIIFFILSFILLDAFTQFFIGKNFFGYEILNYARVSGIFGSELILGSFLIKFLPILLWLIFYSKFKIDKNKYFLIFFFSAYLICIYLSGERTSFALMLFAVVFLVLFVENIKKIFVISFIILIFFALISNTFKIGKADPYDRLINKTFNQITNQIFTKKDVSKDENLNTRSFDEIKKNIVVFSNAHNGHYVLAFKLFKDSPIFGVGPKGFRYHCRVINYDSDIGICSTHPHNIPIQIISEIGIIGFIFYLCGMCFAMIKFLTYYKNKKIDFFEKSCFLTASIALFINFFPFLPSGNFFNNWISIINYFYIGVYLFSYNKINLKK